MSGVGKVVCVTGGSGHVASWLVKLLLQRGYTVRATVRDPQNSEKTLHLRTLEGAPERLHLFKAELLEEGAFDAVVDGCEGIFHTASPFVVDVTDPEAGLIEPAVKGTLNVLSSCAKASSAKRVVVTSSLAAVLFTGRPVAPDVVVDETWFSNPELCRSMKDWYVLSKTLAEEAAWNFSKEKGLDMVSVNPGMVMGPLLQPTLNTSAGAILKLINGSSTFYNATFGWVDVRDVALAHILAYEISSASGRYCVTERVAHYSDLAEILRKLYPNLSIPQKCADDNPYKPKYQVSTERAKSLGVQFVPLEVSLKDTVESLKEKNFVNF